MLGFEKPPSSPQNVEYHSLDDEPFGLLNNSFTLESSINTSSSHFIEQIPRVGPKSIKKLTIRQNILISPEKFISLSVSFQFQHQNKNFAHTIGKLILV
jgi:hypothetical protein